MILFIIGLVIGTVLGFIFVAMLVVGRETHLEHDLNIALSHLLLMENLLKECNAEATVLLSTPPLFSEMRIRTNALAGKIQTMLDEFDRTHVTM